MTVKASLRVALALTLFPACLDNGGASVPEAAGDGIGVEAQGLSGAARRPRSEAIRDVAAGRGMTNGVLLAGIAQVETGLSHCWSEATWACQGLNSPSCGGGPVIAGAADGPCSAEQGGLGMFQFDGGTYAQTIARDGEEILLLEGNIEHAVDFVAERVRQDIPGVDSIDEAIAWLNAVPVAAGDPVFEQWIALVSCRYNGCCGCSTQEGKYRDATLAALTEFEPGFWGMTPEPPECVTIPPATTVLEENDPCAVAGGAPQYWRVEEAGSGGRLMWTHTTDSDTTENFGQWSLSFSEAGTYTLEVATDGGVFAASTQASYLVRHAGEETVVVIDQSVMDGFQLLADFEFDAGGDQWVRFNDNTGEPLDGQVRLAFDALRVTPTGGGDDPPDDDPMNGDDPDDPPGDDDPDDREGGVMGGCHIGGAASGAGGSLPVLLVCIGFVLRRRRP